MIEFGNKCRIIPIRTNNGNNMNSKLHAQVADAMKITVQKAENIVKDNETYKKIVECFENNNKNIYGRAFSFSIEQDEENLSEHILRISLLGPNRDIETTRPLAIGDKKQILNYLRSAESCDNIRNQLLAMSKTLELQ